MAQYLLSVHSVEGEAAPSPSDEEMQRYMEQIHALEDELKSTASAGSSGGPSMDPTPPRWCGWPTTRC